MEEFVQCRDVNLENYGLDEEFRSCSGEDEDWQDAEDCLSEGHKDANEEVPLKVSEGYKEEGEVSTLKISDVLKEDAKLSRAISMENGEDVDKSITFSDGLGEIESECSLRLIEGTDQEVLPECTFCQSIGQDEDVSDCSLVLFEGNKEIVSMSSLMLSEDHADVVSECSIRLFEVKEEDVMNLALGLCVGHENNIIGSSLRLCEGHEEDVSDCSLRLSEDEENISECSLTFFEDHKIDSLNCPLRFHEDHDEDDDGVLVRIFSKGVSVSDDSDLGTRISGIGVVLEKPQGVPFLQVQKKVDFFVEELIAEHLALMDGLLEALRNNCRKVLAFTDSDKFYRMITRSDRVEDQLLIAFQERIQELIDKFESFILRLAPRYELKRPLHLAQEATGALSHLIECYNCGVDKHQSKMIKMDCSHNLCSDCMSIYVETNVRNSRISMKCPHERCTYDISNTVYRSFLPFTSLESLQWELTETEAQNSWRFYCPFSDCSMLLHTYHTSPARPVSLVQSNTNCIECPNCYRHICTRCQVPWHFSMRCEEYQNLPLEEQNTEDITLHQLAQISSWKRCQQCRRMIELTEGCCHVTCWCGHEFCFSCGAEYRYGTQTCQCDILEENSESSPAPSEHETELWRWDCFNLLPGSIDGYTEQERAQLGIIQRFLAGGISLENHSPCQPPSSPPDSYLDTIKNLNQLPWLESFISVIGDSYQEDHIY